MGIHADIYKFKERRNKRLRGRGIGERPDFELSVSKYNMDKHGDGKGGNTRLPYGLCAEAGIDTTDMTPSEAWKALREKTGITPSEAYKELENEGSSQELSKEAKEAKKNESQKNSSSSTVIPAAPIITGTKIPVKTTPKIDVKKLSTLKNAGEKRTQWAEKHSEYAPYTEKVNAGIKYLLDNNEFCINFDEEILEGIIRKGFLNQIQTASDSEISKKTHGAFSPEERRNASNLMFGTPPETEPSGYEKYGYLGNPLDLFEERIAPWYGDCTIILRKDRMKERTTYSFDDSLGMGGSGLAVPGKDGDNPSWEGAGFGGIASWSKKPGERMTAIMEAPEKKTKIGDVVRHGGYYIELQFHGDLTMSDVDTIVFRSITKFKKYVTPDVKEALDALGVKIVKLWEVEDEYFESL